MIPADLGIRWPVGERGDVIVDHFGVIHEPSPNPVRGRPPQHLALATVEWVSKLLAHQVDASSRAGCAWSACIDYGGPVLQDGLANHIILTLDAPQGTWSWRLFNTAWVDVDERQPSRIAGRARMYLGVWPD